MVADNASAKTAKSSSPDPRTPHIEPNITGHMEAGKNIGLAARTSLFTTRISEALRSGSPPVSLSFSSLTGWYDFSYRLGSISSKFASLEGETNHSGHANPCSFREALITDSGYSQT